MHDPELPDHHSPARAGSGTPDGTGGDDARGRIAEKIEQVAAWYAEQIRAERRRPAPTPDRVARLLAERAACVDALRDLPETTGEELGQIEADYDARLSEITGV
ncbi:hypothetical protein ACFU7Y_25850 [Kitasatospora sp. NPDC057542]|uniref:hypothetical protein n=1 Tax=Kitasatospora sp. NPDC057542 TaxID=3346162 RepID=UPI00368D3D45